MIHESDDWYDKPAEQRRTEYARRKMALEEVLVLARMHRLTDCAGAPLCPGKEAADRLNLIPPGQYGDFVATCLAALADSAEEIENLRAERNQLRDRLAAAQAGKAAAEKDADAGWDAYRMEREAHADPEEQG